MTDYKLDRDELTKDAPMLAKGLLKSFIDYLNNLDLDHNGKKDVAQYGPFVVKMLPIVVSFVQNINWQEVLAWFRAHKFAKDEAKLESHVVAIQQTHSEIIATTPKS